MTKLDTSLYVHRFDGMDGSHYQPEAGPYDLAAVREASMGAFFCWKATQSVKYVDPTFSQIRDESTDLDFRLRFWYHWISSATNVNQQVDHYLSTVGSLNSGQGVMLDGEEWDKVKEKAQPGVTHDRYCLFLEGVEDETRRPSSVYTGLYVANGTIWRSPRIRMSKYGPRPMHLAAYVSKENLISRMLGLGVIDLPMHAWQYNSNGPVPGITGRCDMNTLVDPSIFESACGYPSFTWTPDPELRNRPVVGFNHLTWDGFNDYGYVRWVQMFLNRTAPEGCTVSGVWDYISDDRLRKFQGYFKAQGFPCEVNGITDLPTWATIHWVATEEGIV